MIENKSEIKRTGLLGMALLSAALLPSLSGCSSAPQPTPAERVAKIKDLGEGVYQFSVDEWPQNLVDFKRANPEKEITAMFAGERFGGGTGSNNDSVVVNTKVKNLEGGR